MTTDQEQPTETTTTTVATSTTTSTTTFSSSASPAAKKKRGADEHWKKSKDDVSSDEEEDGEGGGTGSGEFQRADADTLSKRRIVKARRPAGMEGTTAEEGTTGGGESKPNPFATISLTGAPAAAAAAASSETTPAPAPAPAPASSSGGGGVFGSSFPKINASSILAGAGGGGWGGGGGSGEMIKPGTGPGLGSVPMGFASYKLNPFQAAARDAKSSSLFASLPLKGSELVGSSSKGGASQFGGGGGGGGGVREGEGDEEGIPEDLEAEPNVTFDVPKGMCLCMKYTHNHMT